VPVEGTNATANNAFGYGPPGWGYLAIMSGKRRISMFVCFMLIPGYRSMAVHMAIAILRIDTSVFLSSCYSAILCHGGGVLLDSQDYVYHIASIAFYPHQWISLAYKAMALNTTIHALTITTLHAIEPKKLFPPAIHTNNLPSRIRRSITEQENNRLSHLLTRPDARDTNRRHSEPALDFRRHVKQRRLDRTTNTTQSVKSTKQPTE
jgi:hypothetical protein